MGADRIVGRLPFWIRHRLISGAEQTIQQLWGLSATLHGLAISMALWGTVLGSLIGGLAD